VRFTGNNYDWSLMHVERSMTTVHIHNSVCVIL
jgi:hypothetical protein